MLFLSNLIVECGFMDSSCRAADKIATLHFCGVSAKACASRRYSWFHEGSAGFFFVFICADRFAVIHSASDDSVRVVWSM